ncbi:hypothetical protein QTP88_011636 [Uroleucon formosanum]
MSSSEDADDILVAWACAITTKLLVKKKTKKKTSSVDAIALIDIKEMCENCLSTRGLLLIDDTCTKIKNQAICGGELIKVLKNSRKRDSEACTSTFSTLFIYAVQ